jgi:hypothetical protein
MRARSPSLVASTVLALLASACLDELPQPSKITGLRVLGVRAEPPEVAPGAEVQLEALVVDALGRDVTLTWYACTIPERGAGLFGGSAQSSTSGGQGYSLSDVGSCADPRLVRDGLSTVLGTGPTATLQVPDDALSVESVRRAYGLPEDVEIPPLALAGLLGIAGVNMTVTLVAEVDGDTVESFKRVNVSLSDARNENPADLTFRMLPAADAAAPPKTGEAEPGECFVEAPPLVPGEYVIWALNVPEEPVDYAVLVGGSSPEQLFQVVTNEETLFYSFFSPFGEFGTNIVKSTATPKVRWTIDELPDEPVDMWVVVRDGRGGTSWCRATLGPKAP